jgi:hypothetical protein
MARKKPSRPITPTGQGLIALVPLYQRLQQAGYTPHGVCAIFDSIRDSPNIEIAPPLPQGRFIPHGEGLALKTADGIRHVAQVYLRLRSVKKSPPPMQWRPEWHAMREVVLRAAHDTAANFAMPKSQKGRGQQQKRGHGYDWDRCWAYALTLRAEDAWDWTEHQRDKKQPLPAVRKVVEDKIKDWFRRTHGGRVPDISDIRQNITIPLYAGRRTRGKRKR